MSPDYTIAVLFLLQKKSKERGTNQAKEWRTKIHVRVNAHVHVHMEAVCVSVHVHNNMYYDLDILACFKWEVN